MVAFTAWRAAAGRFSSGFSRLEPSVAGDVRSGRSSVAALVAGRQYAVLFLSGRTGRSAGNDLPCSRARRPARATSDGQHRRRRHQRQRTTHLFQAEPGPHRARHRQVDGSDVRVVAPLKAQHYQYPRWSPDEQTIAFQAGDGFRWDCTSIPCSEAARNRSRSPGHKVMKGLAWLPDSSGVVFASARASSSRICRP